MGNKEDDYEIDDELGWFDYEYESINGSHRPNVHGGHHASHSSTLQPLSDRIRASPLEVPSFKNLFLIIISLHFVTF